MKRLLVYSVLLVALLFDSFVFSEEISFTKEDRDRLIRLEVRLEENSKFLQKQIDEVNKSLQRQIDEVNKSLQKQIDDVNKSLQKQIDEVNKSFQKQIDDVNKSIQKQIDDLRTFMLWGFGILFGGMGLLIGFVIWDRRTAVAPVAKRQQELEERSEKIEKAFKELAKHDSRVAEILKDVGLL